MRRRRNAAGPAGARRRRRARGPSQAAAVRGRNRRPGAEAAGHEPLAPFILRPVATALLMVAILLSGLLAYRLLPVSALPQVDYPTIQVLTLLSGREPEVMTTAVTAPLERQFGPDAGPRPDDVDQLRRRLGDHAAVRSRSKPLDVAEQEVQAAINAASNLLPTDLPQPPVYNKVNPADAPVLTLAVTSKTGAAAAGPGPRRHAARAEDLAAPGVGLVSIAGGQRPAVRIQANPQALAAHGLNLEDLRTAIAPPTSTRRRAASTAPQRLHDRRQRPAARADAYRDLIVAYRNGAPVRLEDVADVVDGAENNAGGLGQRHARGDHQRPAPARRQRHRGRRPHQGAAAAADRAAAGARRRGAHRPHRHHPRLGARRADRAAASPSPWSCW